MIKMFTMQEKLFFLTPIYLLRAPDNSNFFRFPLKVLIGSRMYIIRASLSAIPS